MKKNICMLLILISYVSCSNGQRKEKSDDKIDYTKEILGCWTLFDAYHEVKSNYPQIDSLCLENRKLYILSKEEESIITKFFKDNTTRDYLSNGNQIEGVSYYEIEGDSFSIEELNTLRLNTRSTSKISINNDTLHLETEVVKEIKRVIGDLKWHSKIDIPKDIKIKVAKRYTTYVRVQDCDQYKE